mmetsp:Transcript_26082/g.37423  ORF Transcript_26082/g.37423 Transcript_26082/m.37423 type:complete len:223 (+) Transcript_26082:77-745(+)|eukprot:CAMPEP_0172414874 /NCGR_PEP_ID=MMETSP1064-20121228/1477_1 /TAXON_ID=202472 /ORGANISM="Aulacoseira subarctica , Strain CCAP 1002/5" /LENGTH=222 /DNA_ID=CAMNT_0013151727 /DNA_START=54 /DNA_END=722 /DNA_ORIENTATION=+
MKMLLKLTSMFVLVGSAASTSYTFTVSDPTACDASATYAITPLSIAAGCSEGASCSVGDPITVDSTFTFSGLTSGEVLANVKVSYGWLSYSPVTNEPTNICDVAVSSDGSTTCPEDGTYTLSGETLTMTQQYAWLAGKSISVKGSLVNSTDTSVVLGCYTYKVVINKSGYTSTAYAALVALPIAGLTVAGSIYRRYRVKSQRLDLEGSTDALETKFVGATLA